MRGGRDGEAPGGWPEIAAGAAAGGGAKKAGQQGASVGGGGGGHWSAGGRRRRRRPGEVGGGGRVWIGFSGCGNRVIGSVCPSGIGCLMGPLGFHFWMD